MKSFEQHMLAIKIERDRLQAQSENAELDVWIEKNYSILDEYDLRQSMIELAF